jgi:hypothetical protein
MRRLKDITHNRKGQEMKNTLLILLLLCAAMPTPAQTIVQQFATISSGAGTVSDMDLNEPTGDNRVLIAMPLLLSPDVTVQSVTDNAPAGGNTYKRVPDASSSCSKKAVEIWYCEKCNPGVTELKFHLSGHVRASINGFLEVSGLDLASVLDGKGVHVNDGKTTSTGMQVGPSMTTTANDFVIARYFADPPLPTGVTPAPWKFTTSYVYASDTRPGTYQPTLTGGKAASEFCMSMAAFKIAAAGNAPAPAAQK